MELAVVFNELYLLMDIGDDASMLDVGVSRARLHT